MNEGGDGNIDITIEYSIFNDDGADVECDERGMGHKRPVEMLATHLTWNGRPHDLDDGFDIDKYNEGNIQGNIVFQRGELQLRGRFRFQREQRGRPAREHGMVEAKRNGEEGIDYEEDDDDMLASGEFVTVMKGVVTIGNRDTARTAASRFARRRLGGCQTYEHPLDRQLPVRRLRPGELRRERTRQYRMGTGTREQSKLLGSIRKSWAMASNPRDRHRPVTATISIPSSAKREQQASSADSQAWEQAP